MLLNVIFLGCLVIKVPKSMYKEQICQQRAVQMWHFDIMEVNMFLRAEIRRTAGDTNEATRAQWVLTRLSSSGSSLKKGLWSCSCWWTKFSMSTSKLAEVMHSDPCVACSHFSNSNARRGKRGCLQDRDGYYYLYSMQYVQYTVWSMKI